MKRILLLALVAGLAVAAPASGASYLVDVPEEFASELDDVKADSKIDVYLPPRIRTYVRASRVRGTATAEDGSYALELGIGRCNGANACYIAGFYGNRGEPFGPGKRVKLRGGRTGRFKPLTCGASCSPPAIQWIEDGVRYEIAYKGASQRAEKRTLIKLANTAIAKGPR